MGNPCIGIDILCGHNSEHSRYIWEFENNVGIIGNILGIMVRFPIHIEGVNLFSVHLLD